MKKYKEKISDESQWYTSTPSDFEKTLPFYIMETGYFIAENGYVTERDTHNSFLLLYTTKGIGRIEIGSISYNIQENCAAVIDCKSHHKYCGIDNNWEFFWVHFNGTAAHSFFNLLPHDVSFDIRDRSKVENLIRIIYSCMNANDIPTLIMRSSKIHSFYSLLISSHFSKNSNNLFSGATVSEKALEKIEQHFSEPITIEQLADELHISKYHFIRIFSRFMGTTPYSYLMSYRINEAKRLLRTTNNSITAISEQCGFSDSANFIAQFKKKTGQRPTQYRNDFKYSKMQKSL